MSQIVFEKVLILWYFMCMIIKELKEAIKDLPDDLEVYWGKYLLDSREFYINKDIKIFNDRKCCILFIDYVFDSSCENDYLFPFLLQSFVS